MPTNLQEDAWNPMAAPKDPMKAPDTHSGNARPYPDQTGSTGYVPGDKQTDRGDDPRRDEAGKTPGPVPDHIKALNPELNKKVPSDEKPVMPERGTPGGSDPTVDPRTDEANDPR